MTVLFERRRLKWRKIREEKQIGLKMHRLTSKLSALFEEVIRKVKSAKNEESEYIQDGTEIVNKTIGDSAQEVNNG